MICASPQAAFPHPKWQQCSILSAESYSYMTEIAPVPTITIFLATFDVLVMSL